MSAEKNAKTAVYRVGGIKGDQCRERIENTFSQLDGVSKVDVDSAAKEVKITHDPQAVSSGYIEETLQALGYSIQGQTKHKGNPWDTKQNLAGDSPEIHEYIVQAQEEGLS